MHRNLRARQREDWEVLMFSLYRATKLCAAIVVAAVMLTCTLSQSHAATGSVRFHIVKAAPCSVHPGSAVSLIQLF